MFHIIYSLSFPKHSGHYNCHSFTRRQASSDAFDLYSGVAQFGSESKYRQTIVTDIVCGFLQYQRKFLGQYLKLDHERFLPRHFRFINHYHPIKLKKNCVLSTQCIHVLFFFIWFVRLLALRPLLAYCASLG
jgi:hypothetical protein